jgi:hypothetical protein
VIRLSSGHSSIIINVMFSQFKLSSTTQKGSWSSCWNQLPYNMSWSDFFVWGTKSIKIFISSRKLYWTLISVKHRGRKHFFKIFKCKYGHKFGQFNSFSKMSMAAVLPCIPYMYKISLGDSGCLLSVMG